MPKLAKLNALDPEEFTCVVAPVFEHSPWVAARTSAQGPFESIADLHKALCETVEKASDDEKLALIRAHPDLSARSDLTPASRAEQASAGLDHASEKELAQLREYTRQYRERFDFPFVICARLNTKEAIAQAVPLRLQNSREEEMEIALQEIFKIADLRLRDLIQ